MAGPDHPGLVGQLLRLDPVANGEGMRLRHGDPCASAGAQLGDVQPVEVVRRQALAPGEAHVALQ